jgi:hypothetical protein
MSGLFTLNDDPLGKLDQGVLGGFGTGFIVGQSTTSGTASGAQGFTGSVAGQSTSAGSASGFPWTSRQRKRFKHHERCSKWRTAAEWFR